MIVLAPILLVLASFQAADSLLPTLPQGWRGERLEFPLEFAPELEFRGIEDLAFAPGMFAPDSDSYFSYALALRLEGEHEVDEAFLTEFLETYYRGLCRAVGGSRGLDLDLEAIAADVRREGRIFRAEVALFDPFTTGGPLELGLELEVHPAPCRTELLGLASPLDREAPVWKELHGLAERWRQARPAPVFLNHVYFVPDAETYAALAQCRFLRDSLAVCEERETVRADTSYEGLYLYGRHTYVEFLAPGTKAPFAAGSSGLALGLELEGATQELARRLEGRKVRTFGAPITRELEGQPLPWFQILGIEMPVAGLDLFTLEYDPRFLASWHPDLEPAQGGIARSDVLERYAAVLDLAARRESAAFLDVSEVRLALDDAQRERLLAVGEECGYELEEGPDTWTCHAPQFRLVLQRSPVPGGITEIDLTLREPLEREPLQLGRVRLSFRGETATFHLRP